MSHLGSHLYSEDSPEIIESATELFEIDDFTSPSPWEKFVSKFEQLLREWNLHKSKYMRVQFFKFLKFFYSFQFKFYRDI